MIKRNLWIATVLGMMFVIFLGAIIAQEKPVEPVNFRELIPFLKDISGWTGEKPEGSTISYGEYKLSQVSRSYSSGEKELTINILDGAYVPMAYASFQMMRAFEIDTSDEYIRKIEISGFPAVERYEYDDKEGTIIIFVRERFLVTLEESGIKNTSGLRDIAQSLDLKGLAALVK
ncbi:MAG: hypothetical protein ACE5WD_02460 [Candidatus Aminicenantia bacterium]